MNRLLFVALGCLFSLTTLSQPAKQALDIQSVSLEERYKIMKTNSQTFQDYKVIKEYVLDGVWKISLDTIAAIGQRLEMANQKIQQLSNDLTQVRSSLESQKQSIAQIEYDSEHISLAGISFSKNMFRFLTFGTIGILAGVILFLVGHWKVSNSKIKEQMLLTDLISKEYDDFKRKALEKQTKLSRELQNERNKLAASNHS